MDKQRLLELAGITEARYFGDFIGTLSNSIYIDSEYDAHRLNLELHNPEIGWHTKVTQEGDRYKLTLTINVNTKNLE